MSRMFSPAPTQRQIHSSPPSLHTVLGDRDASWEVLLGVLKRSPSPHRGGHTRVSPVWDRPFWGIGAPNGEGKRRGIPRPPPAPTQPRRHLSPPGSAQTVFGDRDAQ